MRILSLIFLSIVLAPFAFVLLIIVVIIDLFVDAISTAKREEPPRIPYRGKVIKFDRVTEYHFYEN